MVLHTIRGNAKGWGQGNAKGWGQGNAKGWGQGNSKGWGQGGMLIKASKVTTSSDGTCIC